MINNLHAAMANAPLSLVELRSFNLNPNSATYISSKVSPFLALSNSMSVHQSAIPNTSDDDGCDLMQFPSFALRFFRDFQRFCPIIPDLVLQIDSGERINVHTVIFYCCSSYCRSKLKSLHNPQLADCWSSPMIYNTDDPFISPAADHVSQRFPLSLSSSPIPMNVSSQSNRLLDKSDPMLNYHRMVAVAAATNAVSNSSKDTLVIRVPRVDYDSLRAVVDFVYSGGLIDSISIDTLPKIRFAATLLGIDELVVLCDSLFKHYQQNSYAQGGKLNIINDIDDIPGEATADDIEFQSRPGSRTPSPPHAINNSILTQALSSAPFSDLSLRRCFDRSGSKNIQTRRIDHAQKLPSVASVLAEIGCSGNDARLRFLASAASSNAFGTTDNFTLSADRVAIKNEVVQNFQTSFKRNRLKTTFHRRVSDSTNSESSDCMCPNSTCSSRRVRKHRNAPVSCCKRSKLVNSNKDHSIYLLQQFNSSSSSACLEQSGFIQQTNCFHSSAGKFVVQIVEYMKEDLVMTDKYIYLSRLSSCDSLMSTYNILQINPADISPSSSRSPSSTSTSLSSSLNDLPFEFPPLVNIRIGNSGSAGHTTSTTHAIQNQRHSLLIFNLSVNMDPLCNSDKLIQSNDLKHNNYQLPRIDSIVNDISNGNDTCQLPIKSHPNDDMNSNELIQNVPKSKDVHRFAVLCHLDFSDKESLHSCCSRTLIELIQRLLRRSNAACLECNSSGVDLQLESVFCLKKSSGFKSSFRRESLSNTSECYKALAEYSRTENGELPLVLLSCKGTLKINGPTNCPVNLSSANSDLLTSKIASAAAASQCLV